MPRLLHSQPSPYSAKVRMAAIQAGIELEYVRVDTSSDPAELIEANPLGKIPTLILDDGSALFDSRVIIRHLDRQAGGMLLPSDNDERLAAEKLEALCDGIADCLLVHVYERRFRPEEKQHVPWMERQWQKAMRGLDSLQGELENVPETPHCGHLAARALLGYLALRFSGQWEEGRQPLVDWSEAFDRSFPGTALQIPA